MRHITADGFTGWVAVGMDSVWSYNIVVSGVATRTDECGTYLNLLIFSRIYSLYRSTAQTVEAGRRPYETYVGTSGYSYKEWKGRFYPVDLSAKGMLHYYGERFRTVEINNTFYRMPNASVLETWAADVPADFKFVLKASRQITHMKRLKDAPIRILSARSRRDTEGAPWAAAVSVAAELEKGCTEAA